MSEKITFKEASDKEIEDFAEKVREEIVEDEKNPFPKRFITITTDKGDVESKFLKETFWKSLIQKGLSAPDRKKATQSMDHLFHAKFQSDKDLKNADLSQLGEELSTLEQLAAESTGEDKDMAEKEAEQLRSKIDVIQNMHRRTELQNLIKEAEDKLRDKKQKKSWPELKDQLAILNEELDKLPILTSSYITDPEFEKVKERILKKRKRDRTNRVYLKDGDNLTEDAIFKQQEIIDAVHYVPDGTPSENEPNQKPKYNKYTDSKEYADYNDYEASKKSVPEMLASINQGDQDSLSEMLKDDYYAPTLQLGGLNYSLLEDGDTFVTLESTDDKKTEHRIKRDTFDKMKMQMLKDKENGDEKEEKIGLDKLIKKYESLSPDAILAMLPDTPQEDVSYELNFNEQSILDMLPDTPKGDTGDELKIDADSVLDMLSDNNEKAPDKDPVITSDSILQMLN